MNFFQSFIAFNLHGHCLLSMAHRARRPLRIDKQKEWSRKDARSTSSGKKPTLKSEARQRRKTIYTGQNRINFSFFHRRSGVTFFRDVSEQNCVPLPQTDNQQEKRKLTKSKTRKTKQGSASHGAGKIQLLKWYGKKNFQISKQ